MSEYLPVPTYYVMGMSVPCEWTNMASDLRRTVSSRVAKYTRGQPLSVTVSIHISFLCKAFHKQQAEHLSVFILAQNPHTLLTTPLDHPPLIMTVQDAQGLICELINPFIKQCIQNIAVSQSHKKNGLFRINLCSSVTKLFFFRKDFVKSCAQISNDLPKYTAGF